MSPRIASTGSVIVDLSLHVTALPPVGGDVLATSSSYAVGGGFNLMYAAVRQGVEVVYAGGRGTGPNGILVADALARLGVSTSRAAGPGDTGLCVTLIDASAERTFVTAPGVEATVTEAELASVELGAGDVVALSGYDLAYAGSGDALAGWARTVGRDHLVLLDPGPLVLEIPSARWLSVLPAVAVLTVNEREAALLARDEPVDRATLLDRADTHRRIRGRHPLRPDALLVVRHGADGCTYDGGLEAAPVTVVPGRPVLAVDTTGAGDTHTGVLLAELVSGTATYDALLRANVAAAISVTRAGPASAPSRAEVDAAISPR